MRDIETLFNENIQKAKSVFKSRNGYQLEIAKLALEVCEIKHGGSNKDDLFTLYEFSRRVGVKYKTLHVWTTVYKRIFKVLSPDLKSKASFTDMKRAIESLPSSPSPERVNEKVGQLCQALNNDNKLIRYCSSIKSMIHCLRNGGLETSNIKTLNEISFYCTEVLDILKEHTQPITPINHCLVSGYNNANKKHLFNGDKGKNVEDFLNLKDEKVYEVLCKRRGEFLGPTLIAQFAKIKDNNPKAAMLAALRTLQKLRTAGLVEYKNGKYAARVTT